MEAKDRQELFDRAYRRELSESEQLAFDALLKSDHSVKEQYEAFVEDVMLIEAASFRNQVGDRIIHLKTLFFHCGYTNKHCMGFSDL